MQFVCDSCKAMLQIADEKVRGKRLIVRCKKCGAKITISDPGLGAHAVRASPRSEPAVELKLEPVARLATKAEPGAPRAPDRAALQPLVATRSAAEDESERDSDTESTRAMDSDMLEKALQASKREEAPAPTSPGGAAAQAPRAPGKDSLRPAAPSRDPAPQRDLPVWFAMLGGKQTGPATRAEIALKIAQGAVGPRTYLWKDGMAAWTRAKDVAEVAAEVVAQGAPQPDPPVPAAGPAPANRGFPVQTFGFIDPSSEREARVASERAGSASGAGKSSAPAAGRPAGAAEPGGPVAAGPVPGATKPAAAAAGTAALRPSPYGDPSSAGRPSRTPPAALAPSAAAPAGHEQFGPALGGPAPAGTGSSAPGSAAQAAPGLPAGPFWNSAARPQAGQTLTPAPGGDQPLRSVPLASQDDHTTDVDQLPQGERVHQERVAAELFSSGENPGQSALELARWASSEIGKQRPSSPAPAKFGSRADPSWHAADSAALPPEKPKIDRTGEVLVFAGVQRSRTPLLIALIIGALLVGGVLLWALSSDLTSRARVASESGKPVDAGTPQAPSAGAGDPAVAALAAKAGGTLASDDKGGNRPATKKPDALTSDQQADPKNLANERGRGTDGPSAAPAAGTPNVEKLEVGLTAADVRKKLGQSKGALQGCIDEALRREPNLRVGKIHIATTIAPSGSVTAAKIDKQTVDQSLLGTCLKRATRRIVFPSFQGAAFEVDIPIVVTAGE